MAATYSAFVYDETFTVQADLSAKQFYVMKYGTAEGTVALAGANDPGIGILLDKPKLVGEACLVRLLGKSKAQVDGSGTAIAAGDPLEVDGNGRLIKCVTDKHNVVARANEPATTVCIISVLLTGPYQSSI